MPFFLLAVVVLAPGSLPRELRCRPCPGLPPRRPPRSPGQLWLIPQLQASLCTPPSHGGGSSVVGGARAAHLSPSSRLSPVTRHPTRGALGASVRHGGGLPAGVIRGSGPPVPRGWGGGASEPRLRQGRPLPGARLLPPTLGGSTAGGRPLRSRPPAERASHSAPPTPSLLPHLTLPFSIPASAADPFTPPALSPPLPSAAPPPWGEAWVAGLGTTWVEWRGAILRRGGWVCFRSEGVPPGPLRRLWRREGPRGRREDGGG